MRMAAAHDPYLSKGICAVNLKLRMTTIFRSAYAQYYYPDFSLNVFPLLVQVIVITFRLKIA